MAFGRLSDDRNTYKPHRILYSPILTTRHYYAVGKPLERAQGLPEDFPRDSTALRQIITQRNLVEKTGSAHSRPTTEVVRSLTFLHKAPSDENQP